MAGPVLMPVKGHALQGGKVLPRTVRGVPRAGGGGGMNLCYDSFLAGGSARPYARH